MEKAKMINKTPKIDLKIPSPFPTFFTFTAGFSFLDATILGPLRL
jgi:hypothetical protein